MGKQEYKKILYSASWERIDQSAMDVFYFTELQSAIQKAESLWEKLSDDAKAKCIVIVRENIVRNHQLERGLLIRRYEFNQ
ncbi:MAG: hypothetical protein ACOX2M_03780 [Fastidiosipilaceae bacterium]|jgi:hypothetical protein